MFENNFLVSSNSSSTNNTKQSQINNFFNNSKITKPSPKINNILSYSISAKLKQTSQDNISDKINNFFSSQKKHPYMINSNYYNQKNNNDNNKNNNNNNQNNNNFYSINKNNSLYSSLVQGWQNEPKVKGNNKNNSVNYIREGDYDDEAINIRINHKKKNGTKISINDYKCKNPKDIRNIDNNTKVFNDTIEEGFDNIKKNNNDIPELKEDNISIKKSSTYKIKNNLSNSQIIESNLNNNNNFFTLEMLQKSCTNDFFMKNLPRDNQRKINNEKEDEYENENNRYKKNRNFSCKTRKKRRILITNLKYAQDISKDRDNIILFENAIGVNDCFLNVIIQVLFHIEGYKNKLLQMRIDKDIKNPVFQLLNIFKKYERFSKLNTIDTLSAALLRDSLHCQFGTYPKGKCGDPMETMSEILELTHKQFSQTNKINNLSVTKNKNDNNNYCQNDLCPSHSNFLINLKEMKYCPNCKVNTIQMYDKDCFMYDVFSFEILSKIKNESFYEYKYSLFHKLKQLSQSFGDNKIKLAKCKCKEIKTKKKLYLYNKYSPYLIINITWDSNFPKMTDICKIYGLIPIIEDNRNLFGMDFERGTKNEDDLVTNYYLCSMILYGQNHYTNFIYNKTLDLWSFIDDDNKRNFSTYHELIKYLIMRRSIPVGIIYYHSKNFITESPEKLLLNEEEYNLLYQQSLFNDQRDLEEQQQEQEEVEVEEEEEERQKDENSNSKGGILKQIREKMNNKNKNNSNDRGKSDTDKNFKIKRSKKKNIS